MLKKYLTGGFLGQAKDGSHLRLEPYGHLDLKGIMMSVKRSDLEKTKIQQCETTVAFWKQQSKKVGTMVNFV